MLTAPGKVGALALMSLRMTTCTVRVDWFPDAPDVPVAVKMSTPLLSLFQGVAEPPPVSWATPVISASPAAQSLRTWTVNDPVNPVAVTLLQLIDAGGVVVVLGVTIVPQAVAPARSVLQSLLVASWSKAHSMPASARNRACVLSVRFCEICGSYALTLMKA